jgi:hypothetical protein
MLKNLFIRENLKWKEVKIMKKLSCITLAVFFVFVFGSLTAFAVPIVVNGSFEVDAVPGSGYLSVAGGGVTGWTVGNVAGASYPFLINNSYGAATPYGSQFIVPGYYGVGGTNYVEQTIADFTPGNTYELSFALSSEGYDSTSGQSRAMVSFTSGSSTPAADFTAPPTSGEWWLDWSLFTYNFVADAPSVTIRFTQILGIGNNCCGGGGFDVGLDNVSITSTSAPEPGTLLLLGSGLIGLGFAAKKRFKKQSN